MPDPLPKIWNMPSSLSTKNVRYIDFHLSRPKIDYIQELERFDPVSRDQAPDFIFFKLRNISSAYKANSPDLMTITDGLLIVSQKFRDLLLRFDLGATQLFEVPLYEYDQKTRRPGTWYILHIAVKKHTVIPEKSENVREKPVKGFWGPTGYAEDVLAVHASSAVGEDLWADPHFSGRLFLSDRLKTAIKSEGLRFIHVPMRPCIVVE